MPKFVYGLFILLMWSTQHTASAQMTCDNLKRQFEQQLSNQRENVVWNFKENSPWSFVVYLSHNNIILKVNCRTEDLFPGELIISSPNNADSIYSAAVWTTNLTMHMMSKWDSLVIYEDTVECLSKILRDLTNS